MQPMFLKMYYIPSIPLAVKFTAKKAKNVLYTKHSSSTQIYCKKSIQLLSFWSLFSNSEHQNKSKHNSLLHPEKWLD